MVEFKFSVVFRGITGTLYPVSYSIKARDTSKALEILSKEIGIACDMSNSTVASIDLTVEDESSVPFTKE